MRNRRCFFAFLLTIAGLYNLFGNNFQDIDLSSDDRLLFKVNFESQSAVFLSKLSDLSLRQLTAFPEKLELANNGSALLISNRFGAVKVPVTGGLPAPLAGFPSFVSGNVPLKGRLTQFAASADSRWVLYIESTGHAYGNLFLVNILSGVKFLISEKIELPAADFPASWSPDSQFFVYSKAGRLYYYPVLNDPVMSADERFRLIGNGEITSVSWGKQRDFFYFHGNTLYRIINTELFTRTIYGDFLSIGSVMGTFPLDFDSIFDRYWISPDLKSIVINKNGKGLYYFPIDENINYSIILPHILIPQNAIKINLFWPASGQLTIISYSQSKSVTWRLDFSGGMPKFFIPANSPALPNGALSPNGTKAIFWGDNGIELWDYENWRIIQNLSRENIYSCVWINESEFASGNNKTIDVINISDNTVLRGRTVCFSDLDEFSFEEAPNEKDGNLRIAARVGSSMYVSDGINPWAQSNTAQLRKPSVVSGNYRVYLENQPYGSFKNIPMVRKTSSTGTISLLSKHTESNVYTQAAAYPVALCFDLYDDDTGLQDVLNALRNFNIQATFFLNGDFIRRNPAAAKAIADAGHETGSLFYAPIDLSDSRYRITPEFIGQGLARNEDEFFKAAGVDFSLLWHPPYYRTSASINSAALSSGYVTVSRDVDCGDWLPINETLRLRLRYFSSSEMIEQILEKKKSHAVIPIRLGLLQGGRDDYLFKRIDVLLDALIRSGCEIVTVSKILNK
ncbi:MAG: polysaccharide deacetylase family protein [Treponema sp.]|jgi:peptidoglycan/xylan/chitin deacetylase (PgdA/CDA1 family)|nr:polysaccharide deacetylase family protein [Treponema sp.]